MQQTAFPINGLTMNEIQTHSSDWSPDNVQVTLNARIDARLVPCAAPQQNLRLSYGHIVVLDNFIGEGVRQELLDFLTKPGWDHSKGPPACNWERETADGAGLPKTWGLRQSVLDALVTCSLPAMKEVHTRLVKLYPEYRIAHMPSDLIQQQQQPTAQPEMTGTVADSASVHSSMLDMHKHTATGSSGAGSRQVAVGNIIPVPQPATVVDQQQKCDSSSCSDASASCDVEEQQSVHCAQFVGNAAVYGDGYTWHVDADPAAFPPSPWVKAFGSYCNGEPGNTHTHSHTHTA